MTERFAAETIPSDRLLPTPAVSPIATTSDPSGRGLVGDLDRGEVLSVDLEHGQAAAGVASDDRGVERASVRERDLRLHVGAAAQMIGGGEDEPVGRHDDARAAHGNHHPGRRGDLDLDAHLAAVAVLSLDRLASAFGSRRP